MSLTVLQIQNELNSAIGDTSTDRITAAERLQAISEGCIWAQEELANDLQNYTFSLDYFDTVNYYKVTSDIADLLEGADLRRTKDKQNQAFAHKSPREVAEDIGGGSSESSWTIERRDGDTFVGVNHFTDKTAITVSNFGSLTANGGTWAVDATNSDATNLTVDSVEFQNGTASLNFDVDVSQSANNRATILNSDYNDANWSGNEDVGSHIIRAYLPSITSNTFTVYWGSDSSNYWSATVTTDLGGSAFAVGWNRFKVDWSDATATGSPDATAITYLRIDFNYGAGQGDDTDYRIDDWILANPEELTYHYLSWKVGTDTTGATDLFKFAATTDIPYFSGMYDNVMYPVAHKAASIIFRNLRLFNESQFEEQEALKSIKNIKKLIPSSRIPETRNFKVLGLKFGRRR